MEKQIELRKLSETFYKEYPFEQYPELERKGNRPYVVLIILIFNNKFALPFRTNIRHRYCYKFKNTSRKTQSVTGIDFSKAVVINKEEYLGEYTMIDFLEYIELTRKIAFIIKEFTRYVSNYFKYINGSQNKYLIKRYKYSTLNYFKQLLVFKKRIGAAKEEMKGFDISMEEFDAIPTFEDLDESQITLTKNNSDNSDK